MFLTGFLEESSCLLLGFASLWKLKDVGGAHFLTPLTIPYRNSYQHASCCMQSLHLVFLAGLVGVGFPAGIGGGQVATEALSMVFA